MKWIKTHLQEQPQHANQITLNFLSFVSAGTFWPVTGAKAINDLVFREIVTNHRAAHRLGVIAMDFAGNTLGFIEEIIKHNTFANR